MNTGPSTSSCVSCGKTEQERPLLHMSYRASGLAICPQCLPLLIHKPERLAEQLGGIAGMTGAPPCHD